MGLDNPLHIAFLLVILLLVFGAKRLPEIGRSLGEGLRGFKSSIEGGPVPAPASAPRSAPLPVAVHAPVSGLVPAAAGLAPAPTPEPTQQVEAAQPRSAA